MEILFLSSEKSIISEGKYSDIIAVSPLKSILITILVTINIIVLCFIEKEMEKIMNIQTIANQTSKGLRIALILAVLCLNFGASGTGIAYAAPSNDDIGSATPINSVPFSDALDTTSATQPASDPDQITCDLNGATEYLNYGLHSVWYTFNPGITKVYTLDTTGSNYATFIAVWEGAPPTLGVQPKYCVDGTYASTQAKMTPTLTAGITYYIEIAANNGTSNPPYTPTPTTLGSLKFSVYTDNFINVTIGGVSQGDYKVASGNGVVKKYPVDGAVEITNTTGAKIIASLNQFRKLSAGAAPTGVTQSMGLPVDKVSNIYVMPRYDFSSPGYLYDAVLLANVDTVSRDITVTIGGTPMGTYTLAPSESQYKLYSGVATGPLVVSSVTGAKIIASLYELRRNSPTSGWNGQSEMMGLPWEQLSDTYLIPIYFGDPSHFALDAQLFIANPDTVARDITVKIGGNVMGTYTLQPNTGLVRKYPVDGAMEISSTAGAKIIASLNQFRKLSAGAAPTGVAQSMALPVDKVSNVYVMPRYDYSNPGYLYDAVLLANVDTVARDITVTIGGTPMGTYTLAPSESQYKLFSGTAGGPLVVSSVTGAKIVASLYELRRNSPTSGWNGQSEMMGLPWEQLSDKYLIPIYFGDPSHFALDASLFIAVP